ncbi:MAG: hypothetical protein AAF798_06440 [Bacteroidota bacterium]
MSFKSTTIGRWIVPIFFLLYLGIGLSIVPDYGMSWDEAVQRRYGLIALDYYIDQLGLDWEKSFPEVSLETAAGRQYTVLFPTVCAALERLFGLTDNFRGRYLMRHYAVFLLFWLSTIFFFRLLKMAFQNQWLALLGVGMLLLSPRIFAHSFFNPKDIVLLVFYTIAAFTLVRFIELPSTARAVSHAIASALVINARILGIIIPAVTLVGIGLLLLRKGPKSISYKKLALSSTVYLTLTTILTLLLFPYLWAAPAERASESFNMMANFPWGSSVLYFGQLVEGEAIPWHYPFAWIGITTPLVYLPTFLIGCGVSVFALAKATLRLQFWNNQQQLVTLFALALFFGPLAAVLIKSSTLYNGWRQLYFIYPMFLIIALSGIQYLWKVGQKNGQWLVIAALAFSIGNTLRFMVNNHPHQQVYFNALAGTNKVYRFDMDYWGVAYKQAFEQIVACDTSTLIQVNCNNYPCEDNFRFLPEATKSRLKLRYGPEVADYVLSNFRRSEAFKKFKAGAYPFQNPAFFIEVEGDPIIGIYQPNKKKN